MQMVRGKAGRTCQTETMELSKHHGLGNDFLIAFVNFLPEDASAMAEALCHRNYGIGADGMIFALPGSEAAGIDVTMVLFNADGSRAEMSGNGIRCLAQACIWKNGLHLENSYELEMRVGTDKGVRELHVESTDDPHVLKASVDMGSIGPGPKLDSIDYPGALRFTTADVGNPHLVVLVSDVDDVDVAVDGARLSDAAGRVNVEFISPLPDRIGVEMRVWERGVGVTESCGTGACAAAQAAHDWGMVDSVVLVEMPGGPVVVQVGDPAVLIGPAIYIATVTYG